MQSAIKKTSKSIPLSKMPYLHKVPEFPILPRIFAAGALLLAAILVMVAIISAGESPRSKVADTGPRIYRVQSGDTLSGIASRQKTDTATLEELNPQIDPQTLLPGQKIRLR